MSASRIDVADIWIGLEDVIQEERGSHGNPDEQYGAVQEPLPQPHAVSARESNGGGKEEYGYQHRSDAELLIYPEIAPPGSGPAGPVVSHRAARSLQQLLVLATREDVRDKAQQSECGQRQKHHSTDHSDHFSTAHRVVDVAVHSLIYLGACTLITDTRFLPLPARRRRFGAFLNCHV